MTIADEIAARYGVPVKCQVQIIPQGVTGLPDPTIKRSWKEAQAHRRRIENRQIRFRRAVEKAAEPQKAIKPPAAPRPVAPKIAKPPVEAKAKERANLLRELVGQGMTPQQIANRLGIRRKSVYEALAKIGVKAKRDVPHAADRSPKPSVDDRASSIRALAESGMNSQQIADHIGLGRKYVMHLARESGIKVKATPLPKRGGPVDIQAISLMYIEGASIRQIAKTMRRSDETINAALDECGIRRRERVKAKPVKAKAQVKDQVKAQVKRAVITGSAWQVVADMAGRGMAKADIATALDMPIQRVVALLRSAA